MAFKLGVPAINLGIIKVLNSFICTLLNKLLHKIRSHVGILHGHVHFKTIMLFTK